MTTRTFDWRPRHDPRSRLYPVRALTGTAVRRRRVLWSPGPVVLDQGVEGACVPHAFVHEATASPVRVDLTRATRIDPAWPRDPQALAFELYDWCRRNDAWPGEAYEGTSTLAGAKAMVMLGLIREYRWAFTPAEVVDALLRLGPVTLGIPWRSGMYEAPGGVLKAAGDVVGGHAILAVGYDPARDLGDGPVEAVALLNSWGPGWGRTGVAWISLDGLAGLLAQDGEACVPVRRTYGRVYLRAALAHFAARHRPA